MNRTSKRVKMESAINRAISTTTNGDRIHSGHYMTSCLNDDHNEDTVEMPIASPDLANEVPVTEDTDEPLNSSNAKENLTTTALQTSNMPNQLQSTIESNLSESNKAIMIKSKAQAVQRSPGGHFNQQNQHYQNKVRAVDDNHVSSYMASVSRAVMANQLGMNTNGGSISGGLTLDKANSSLKNLIYYIKNAYSSNLTSPKWKNFKGLKLQVAEKIRLNNVIWRTWFEQCTFLFFQIRRFQIRLFS
jgi:hypothetical protein